MEVMDVIIKVCDRCGKHFSPPSPLGQAKLFNYSIFVVEKFGLISKQVDLRDACQDDFLILWMAN